MNEVTKRGRGRPVVGSRHDGRIEIRVTDTERARISELSERTGKSITDTIRDAIEVYENHIALNDKLFGKEKQ